MKKALIIILGLLLIIGGVILLEYIKGSDQDKNGWTEDIIGEYTGDWISYKNEDGIEMFKYPTDFSIEETYGYNALGELSFTGLSIVPPASISEESIDNIWIGAYRVSTCSEVPQSTKCVGGDKKKTITFTNSSNDEILRMFDLFIDVNGY